jgi:hypothetical protein
MMALLPDNNSNLDIISDSAMTLIQDRRQAWESLSSSSFAKLTPHLGSFVITFAIVVFWIFVFITGQPAPFIDDIFYTGAAINFAKHGVMYNPHLRLSWPFLTSFNIYPPIEQFALGYWLSFWGISTNSVLSFFMVCNMITSLAITRLITHLGLHRINVLIAVFIVANSVLFLGLRVDAFGLACIFSGIALTITKPNKLIYIFLGSFLAFIGSISAPSYLIPGISWFLVTSYFSFRSSPQILGQLASWFLGAVAAGLAFLASISLDVGDFLHNFLFHAKMNFHPPTAGIFVVLLIIAIAACASSARLRLIAIALGIATISFLIHPGPTGFELLVQLCATGIIAVETLLAERRISAMVLRSALLASLFIIGLPWLGYAIHSLLEHPSRAELESLEQSKLLAAHYESLGKSIAIDPFVARKYYDFRIPDRAVDWRWGITVADGERYRLRDDVTEDGINGIWLLDSFLLESYYNYVDRLGFAELRQAAISSRTVTDSYRIVRDDQLGIIRLEPANITDPRDIVAYVFRQMTFLEPGFEWWRIRVFELLPMRFMNKVFFGQNFVRYFPLGGFEDPILIDVLSKRLYRGDQMIFDGNRG